MSCMMFVWDVLYFFQKCKLCQVSCKSKICYKEMLKICIGYQECLGHKSKICVGRYSSVFIFLYYLFFIAEKHIQILCFNGYVAQ